MKTGMIPKQEVFDTKSKITSEINSLKYEINSKNSDENSDDNLSSSESEYEEPILDRFKKIEDIRQQKMSIMGRKEHQKKILIEKKILPNDDDTEELKDTKRKKSEPILTCNHFYKMGPQLNRLEEDPDFQKYVKKSLLG